MIAALEAHDTHFSFGENLGAADCDVPVGEHPLAADAPAGGDGSVAASRPNPEPRLHDDHHLAQQGEELDYQGRHVYWTKDREFREFLDLPRPRPTEFRTGRQGGRLGQKAACQSRLAAERFGGISGHGTLSRLHPQSRGEFTVARDQYVRPNTGWFSDRSACYLAAGRPVITQETGFSKFLPTRERTVWFQTMDDILAAVDAIESDYKGNCGAARGIASEFFEAEKVVGSLMQRAGL